MISQRSKKVNNQGFLEKNKEYNFCFSPKTLLLKDEITFFVYEASHNFKNSKK